MTNVFEHPWLSGLFEDPEVATQWSAKTQLDHMIAFEVAWVLALDEAGIWSGGSAEQTVQSIRSLAINPEDLALGTASDGVCVPALVNMLREACAEPAIHKGATSQDVIDTATVLSAKSSIWTYTKRLLDLAAMFETLIEVHGQQPLMGRTRMQAAEPIMVSDRLAAWLQPIPGFIESLKEIETRLCRVQVGGAVGDRRALGTNSVLIVESLARQLGLVPAKHSWHSTRDTVTEFAGLLSRISGALGKLGQDVCLMSQQGLGEISFRGGGSSSAMPHKQNPILAELLVSLARFNAVQVSGMHHSLIHEQERSGAAWTLEWMILPMMVQASGRSITASMELLRSIERIGSPQD